jgi:hypothetical protein
VIPLIHEDDHIVFSEFFRHAVPVIQHAEEPVKDDEGFALAEDFMVELHGDLSSYKVLLIRRQKSSLNSLEYSKLKN